VCVGGVCASQSRSVGPPEGPTECDECLSEVDCGVGFACRRHAMGHNSGFVRVAKTQVPRGEACNAGTR